MGDLPEKLMIKTGREKANNSMLRTALLIPKTASVTDTVSDSAHGLGSRIMVDNLMLVK